MSTTTTSTTHDEVILHVWPGAWNLPSINAECLAAILYAQLSIPGRFVVEESVNPDLSPDGHLPYLSHGLTTLASFPSIAKYIRNLKAESDRETEPQVDIQLKAQHTAWQAFAHSHLGDLLACSFYTLRHNYWDGFRPVIASMLPFPQRYYIPDRLREGHKARLEAAGLWDVAAEEAEEEIKHRAKRNSGVRDAASQAFGNEKVLGKARNDLDILTNLLGNQTYILGSQPTELDSLVSAHILLLTQSQLPNDLLRSLITATYLSLHDHAKRVLSIALPDSSTSSPSASLTLSTPYASEFDLQSARSRRAYPTAPLVVRPPPSLSLLTVLPSLSGLNLMRGRKSQRKKAEKSDEDRTYVRLRWGWFALAAASVVVWASASGLRIRVDSADEEGGEFVSEKEVGDDDDEGDDEDGEGEGGTLVDE